MADRMTPREMLERLVAFPTVSRDSNLDLVHWVRDYLAAHGVEATLVPSPDGRKANLYALIGPEVDGGVVLSGHTDVVPVDGQDWTTDPWVVTERDGLLYGRGTADMKGFIAIALALVPEMLEAGLKKPVQLALSYDEEVGHLGVPFLITEMQTALPAPAAVLVGEPTMMQVVSQHKGGVAITTHVHGYEVHSSRVHEGVSAITWAAKLVNWHAEQMEANRIEAERLGAEGVGADFDPPYTTLHNGLIQGGTAGNITAKDCIFSTDIRVLPLESAQDWLQRYQSHCAELTQQMQAIHPDAWIEVQVRVINEGCRREEDGAAEGLARALTGDNAEHAVSYGTEASNFQREGFSVCVIGPGDIAQAHKPDEFLAIEQLDAGTAFMRRLIDRLSA
ncbi:acetylornithine deacetylase [Oceanicella sp. SM1341]|uniref:acetylornithine deacetylase n=1 Tax=Oceanicella sp. SM1341 TaxID=1548889 RepID=UPI000E4DEAB8|nr:acetylornithine deacetylase [Oceanicella sp. SM1341]